ncbi:MAG: S8 family serine peptidase, partial [Bacteroidota bacterium]
LLPGTENPPTVNKVDYGVESATGAAMLSLNQIVVRYKKLKTPGAARDTLRADLQSKHSFTISEVKTCNCNLTDIELWTIDTTGYAAQGKGGVEDVLKNMENDEDEDDMEGDHQFYFNMQTNATPCYNNGTSVKSKVNTTNNDRAINVAVIDTGLDYQYFSSVLYNSKAPSACDENISGWDFVNDDNDPLDDHYHGTLVTQILTQSFDSMEIPYRILPLKAFDENGRGSYFDVMCAIRYIKEQGDINIVNMSFGWNELDNIDIMKGLIDETKQTLFVASAGNRGKNTDLPGNEHYPSGFDSNNLLAVAGYVSQSEGSIQTTDATGSGTNSNIMLDPRSNYGQLSIDIAAPFIRNIRMERCDENGKTVTVEARVGGTSYGVPFVIGRAGYHLYNNTSQNPAGLKAETDRGGFVAPDFGQKLRRNIAISNQLNRLTPAGQ